MAQEITTEECVYIDLDEPTPWWASLVGIVAVVLIAGVLVAPWVIDIGNEPPDQIANNTLQSSSNVCRPNSEGVPGFFDPTMASWNRFCEWFIDPGNDAP